MNPIRHSEEELKTIFASSWIESAANHLGCTSSEIYFRMKKVGLIEDYIWKYYDTLHTQSREYVVEDILDALYHWEETNRENTIDNCLHFIKVEHIKE